MKRNKFSLSNYHLTSIKMGGLYPIGLTEVLPGDTIQHNTSALIRCNPLESPVMHPVHVRIHHWFVPHRLVWTDWEPFITQGPSGTSAPTFPTITAPSGGFAVSSLADHLGVPPSVTGAVVSALPFRGYNLIYNNWYADQDLDTQQTVSLADGADTTTNTTLLQSDWEKDYFTSARPWTQKGSAVTIPIAGNANVYAYPTATAEGFMRTTTTGTPWSAAAAVYTNQAGLGGGILSNGSGSTTTGYYDPNGSLYANLGTATGVSIDTFRTSLALQRFEEARARFGSRYVEYLRYLGVKSSDARLQLPEYLGGGKQTIQFSEVLQTSESQTGNPLGALGGHGIAAMRSNRYRRFFEEHGYIFTLASVRPISVYENGVARTWTRRTYTDFYQRELEHVGQQPVLNSEIYMQGTSADTNTFGYQDRYDEYRRQENQITGQMRSGQIFDTYNFGRSFGALPTLNSAFVQCVPTTVPFADTSDDNLICMIQHSIQARRLLGRKGNPLTF